MLKVRPFTVAIIHNRVVLLNEEGERVLDTLIKIEDTLVHVKQGLKQDLLNLSKAKGPELKSVQQKVVELMKGRTIVGYHIELKLNNLGIFAKLLFEDKYIQNRLIDLAKVFNKTAAE